jgi:tetratricopeptide (TPR) repeat protein
MPPLVFLMESKRARDLAFWMMERTGRPRQLAELYLLTGQICALMSVASFDLAAWPAAVEQAHAAAAYAELADHRSLEAWAHGMQALTANWCGRAREAVALTDAALSIAPSGTARARLYSISARAWAHLGVAAATREALALAGRERDSIGEGSGDELHDVIGGQFGWGPARQAMSSASALLLIGDSSQAADCAREAIRLGARDRAGSVVGMSARADLARAELAGGRLDAAGEALRPVWGLAPEHRRYGLVERLHGVAGALTRSPFTGAPEAAVLAERIEVFEADSAPRSRLSGLGGSLLPGGE